MFSESTSAKFSSQHKSRHHHFITKMNLEERLAHLQWRKVCNQSQIQGALKSSKQLHEKDILLNATGANDRTKWVKQVVRDEMTRPLEVPLAVVDAMQKETEDENQAMERAAALHMTSVASIQAKIKLREEQAKRQKAYRKVKQQLLFAEDGGVARGSRPPSPAK
ncbi:Aste57867_24066 [Aphanomyces stellatus]|uniref:Aste57867_24066 protein n=1 Tax=Aphanomyces stellatus TaxID=120398 RepID=A0A485LQ68_9STRA|nr:hypothetical protein As57867_023993 [Aphanomyces stellatus]VFU00709.1 Aste57867_24066 [Aphanomyces stellatus]